MSAIIKRMFTNPDGSLKPRENCGALIGAVGLACNIVLCAAKMVAGLISGSVSIVADAVNNLSDAGASAVTLLSFKIAKKPADKEHPYGHARVEYLAGALIAVVILMLGIELVKTSVQKIIEPVAAEVSALVFAILICSISVKAGMAILYKNACKMIKSGTLEAASDDSRNDVFTTAGVLVGAVVQYLWGFKVDGYVGAFVALFILWSGIKLLKDALQPLIGTAPPQELVVSIQGLLGECPEIFGIHDLIVHSYGPGREFASVHAEMSAEADAMLSHGIIDNIERRAEDELGVKLVIHFDPIDDDDETRNAVYLQVEKIVKDIDENLSIHDLRIVKAHDHMNIVFDVAVAWEYKGELEDLRRLITAGIKALDENYYAVVELDRSYVERPQ